MTSPFDLRLYTSHPSWVIAMGIKNDVRVDDSGYYWNLVTATANGACFSIGLRKNMVDRAGKPSVNLPSGLIEIKFNSGTEAAEWVAAVRTQKLVEMFHVKNRPGSELNPPVVAARTCCDSFENELHKNPCKDFVVSRGVIATFPAEPPVAKAEPGANLCSICWNHYYGTGTGRPCGECKL